MMMIFRGKTKKVELLTKKTKKCANEKDRTDKQQKRKKKVSN